MDNVDAISDQESMAKEVEATAYDAINLSAEDKKTVELVESQAIIGGKGNLRAMIVQRYPKTYSFGKDTLEAYIDKGPAWGFHFYNKEGKFEYVACINTEIITDPKIIPPQLRHEAVEGLMQNKNLDPGLTAAQIGVDWQVIKNDPYNGIEHYVAMYHELKLAEEQGVLDEVIEFRRTTVGGMVKDWFMPNSKLNEDGTQNTDWKKIFKDSSGEYAKLNFLIPKQMAEKIRSESKSSIVVQSPL